MDAASGGEGKEVGDMLFVAGVDVGSTQTKAVVLNSDREIIGRALIDTGAHVTRAAETAFRLAVEDANLETRDIVYIVGTGYGRYRVTFGHSQVTEISCHARGAHFLFPGTRTVLDIGGQDTKAIRVGPDGQVLDFCMNDKCAAGTGRFLGGAADALEIPLDELGPLALKARLPVKITTTCTVFAESEIISWLAKGKKVEDILMGVHEAIARRSITLVRRVGIEPEVTFTGGVTRNKGMVEILPRLLGVPINVSNDSQMIGSIGAALFALDRATAEVAGIAGGGSGGARVGRRGHAGADTADAAAG